MSKSRLRLVHVELSEANAFVAEHHRHHKPVVGHRFSIGCTLNESLVGVAIIGRPVARKTDQWQTVEVTRLATDGTRNACSFLYGAAARAAKTLGYVRIQTFILEEELGTSLKAAEWTKDADSPGGLWKRTDGAPRRSDQPQGPKQRWAKNLRTI